jgi:DNA-binding MarR family transcriptional regulator
MVAKTKADLIPLVTADIYELAGAFRRRGERIASGVGQTQARWQVLSAASDHPRTVPQLARILGVSRQNVQRIADLLVDEALAAFTDNPDHRTSPHLALTEKGHRTVAGLTRAAGARHDALAAKLKAVDLAALRRNLAVIQAALDSEEDSTDWKNN